MPGYLFDTRAFSHSVKRAVIDVKCNADWHLNGEDMKHPTKRKVALKARVLAHSSAVAKKMGMAALTVDTVMRGIDRTGSGFYTIFASKAQLLQALVENELALSVERFSGAKPQSSGPFGEWMQKIRRPLPQDPVDDWVETVLRPYLSLHHVATSSEGCALPALSTDIARISAEARVVYEDAMGKIVKSCRQRTGCSDATAWAVIAQCIGTINVARALASDKGREVMLRSSVDFIKTALKKEADEIRISALRVKVSGNRLR